MQDATGSKLAGLWFIVGMCIIGALLSLILSAAPRSPTSSPPPTKAPPNAPPLRLRRRPGAGGAGPPNHHCKDYYPMDFTAKRVLVTAGANGIGLAIAQKFQELGAAVFVTDIDRRRRREGHASTASRPRSRRLRRGPGP